MREPEGRICRGGAVVLALLVALVRLSPALAGATAAEPPASLRDTGLYADFDARRGRSDEPRLLAAISALDRRRREAALDLAAARDRDRRLATRTPGCFRPARGSGRSSRFDGRPSRPASSSALRRRKLALRRLCLERGRPRGGARARDGAARHLRPGRAGAHTRFRAATTAASATRAADAGARLQRAAALARPRSAGAARRRAPRGVDLRVPGRARRCCAGLPPELLAHPPRIEAATPAERAALGYLHGNCGHCHNDEGPLAELGCSCATRRGAAAQALRTIVGVPVKQLGARCSRRTRAAHRAGPPATQRARRSAWARADPLLQMPPLGTELVDEEALALLRRWIAELDAPKQGHQPATRRGQR